MKRVIFFANHIPHALRWLLLGSGIGYFLIFRAFPLIPYYNSTQTFDIRSFTPSLRLGMLYGLLLIALFGLYGLGYVVIQSKSTLFSLPTLLLTITLLALPLLFTYPYNATDIYRYVIRGRVLAVYGQSQYEQPPSAFPDDPFANFAGEWAAETSPYGPLWELTATAVSALTQDNLLAGLLAFKLLALLCHLAMTALIWHMHGDETQRGLAWLWGANPALLLIFVANGHNDALMLLWLLLAIFLIGRERFYWGVGVAILAPLTKPIGLLALPFIGLLTWRTKRKWRERVAITAVSLFLFILFTTFAFLPFGSPLMLVDRLGRELTAGASFSPSALLILLAYDEGLSFSFDTLILTGQIGFGIVALGLIVSSLNGRSPHKSSSDIFAAYLLQAFNFRIWYASWLFPFTLTEDEPEMWRVKTAVYFLLTSQLSVLIYGHLRFYKLDDDLLDTHLIGVLFTFVLPLLLGRLRIRVWGLEARD